MYRKLEDRKLGTKKREKSQALIVKSLLNTPRGFNDLKRDTELTARGLSVTLKLMLEENIVESVMIGNRPKYRLTKEGENIVDKYLYISHDVEKIRFRDGRHFRDYSSVWHYTLDAGLPWGIESDYVVDNSLDAKNLLSEKDVLEIEELLYRKLEKNILKKKLDQNIQGQMVLGFFVDYPELVNSINKQSLDYMNNISKEEVKLLNKYLDDPETMTDKEFKRMNNLREKTREKIKKTKS